jgi:hypothetical protein
VVLAYSFWVGDKNAREARDRAAQVRLLAARIRAEAENRGESSVDQDLLDLVSRQEDDQPELIFHLVRAPGEVEQVNVFLDEKMRNDLHSGEPWAWQGLIEFIEDDVAT